MRRSPFIVPAIVGMCLVSCGIVYALYNAWWSGPPYCDLESLPYRAFLQHRDEWWAHFEDGGSSFRVAEEGQQPYSVGIQIAASGAHILFVEVWSGAGAEPGHGEHGFIYTPTGELPEIYYGIPQFDQIDENIYCYRVDD